MMKPKLNRARASLGILLGLVLWAQAAEADRVTYLHVDALGSPSLATDENGSVLWREHYEPFGTRIEKVAASADNPLWFTGQEQDAATGLVHMGARYYHPGFGRFLSVDPAPVDFENPHLFNRYAYANNNPYRYVDPQGELPIFVPLYVIYKVGSFAFDAYSTYETVNDPNASDAEKAFAVGSFALGTIDPSGATRAVRVADRVVDTTIALRQAERVAESALEGRIVIGKLDDLKSVDAGERTLLGKLFGDLGSPKANWARNAGALREEMAKGLPIRDASVNPKTGELLRSPGSFLEAERNLLKDRGWNYDPKTTSWVPPSK